MIIKNPNTMNKVLIAESSKILQTMIKKTLNITQYDTEIAETGTDALALIEKNEQNYIAVLLDLCITKTDSIETLKRIRNLNEHKAKTIVIGMTGNHKQYTPAEFKKFGFNAVIIKPIDCSIIVDLLERLNDPVADSWLGVVYATGRVEF